jgi:electron transfer flavoprotein alpha subunit
MTIRKRGVEKTKNIWVLPEINPRDKEIGKISLKLLGEARRIAQQVDGTVTALLFSESARQIPGVLAKYGVSRAYLFLDPIFERFSAEAYAAAILPRMRLDKPWFFLLGQTPVGIELGPHLAAMLETEIITGCVKIDLSQPEKPVFYRPVYGGRLYQEITLETNITLLVAMESGALDILPSGKSGETKTMVIESKLPADLIKTRHLQFLPADFHTVDVAEAPTIIAAGMGAASDDIYPLVTELAGLVEGTIGATRPVVDEGIIPRDRLIGQTGKTVGPDFYLALGVSGASHHTGGIQDSGKIVAVNRDPQAPIFRSADAAAVADLREVLPKLIARIKKAKADGEIL